MPEHAGLRRHGTWTLTDTLVLGAVVAAVIGTFVTASEPAAPRPARTSVYASPVPSPTAWDSGAPMGDPEPAVVVVQEPAPVPTVTLTGIAKELARQLHEESEGPQSTTPTAVCVDGWVSYSLHRRGTCSHHGGVDHWVATDVP